MGKVKIDDMDDQKELSEADLKKVKGGADLLRVSTTPLRAKKKGNVEYGWKVEEGES